MNKKAQTGLFLTMMIGIVLFILGFALAPALVNNSSQVMVNMGCSENPETWLHITCTLVDIVAPWVIGLIMCLAGLAFGAKFIM